MKMISERVDTMSGWSRVVEVDGQQYAVSVRRGKSVRIAYKPRGQNRGWQWWGAVYRVTANHGFVWEGRVPGSLGCRGLLIAAGIIPSPQS